jgi:hypothetical protein
MATTEFATGIEAHKFGFEGIEIMRKLARLSLDKEANFEELSSMVNTLSSYLGPFTVSSSELLKVRTIKPEYSKTLTIKRDDTHGEEGRMWFPSPGTSAYEEVVTRGEDGQAVFTGHLYTFTPFAGGRSFEVHNLDTQAVVIAAPNTRVDLVDIEPFTAQEHVVT